MVHSNLAVTVTRRAAAWATDRAATASAISRVGQRGNLRWMAPSHSKSIFCFEQALVALSFSQKFLAFRSRLIFFRRLNLSGDRLIQFVDGPIRYWLPAHDGFLAVADHNPSFTGCPTFTRQLAKLMP